MKKYTDQSIAFADAYRSVSKRLPETPFIKAYETYLKVSEAAERNRSAMFSLDDRCLALVAYFSLVDTYFVASVDHALIKIGKTKHIGKRFSSLQTMSPAPLELAYVVEYDVMLESRIHAHLAEYRAHGEWFHATPEVVDFIRGIKDNGHRWLIDQVGDACHEWIAQRRLKDQRMLGFWSVDIADRRRRSRQQAKIEVHLARQGC